MPRSRVQQRSQNRRALRWQRLDNHDDPHVGDFHPSIPIADREPRQVWRCSKCGGEVYGPALFCQECLYIGT